jgi:vesicle coat complex subunit
VRKNAVLTVFTIFENSPDLIPDAPELIEAVLYAVSANIILLSTR